MAKHKTINFRYKGEDYTLEFDRETVKCADIAFKDLETLDENPEKAIEILPKMWRCAFIKHHPNISPELVEEIYENMLGKQEELPEALVGIYSEPIASLFSEQGNIKWTKSW